MGKVYFAHPVSDYETDFEGVCLETIARLTGFEVENPNQAHHREAYKTDGMPYFEGVLKSCDSLVFSRFKNGKLGAGVAKEIGWALNAGKDVWEIKSPEMSLDRVTECPDSMSVEETRTALAHFRDLPNGGRGN